MKDIKDYSVEYYESLANSLHKKSASSSEGGGGASSWNDLDDKPFGETVEEKTFTWDGNAEGLLQNEFGVRVSKELIVEDINDLMGAKVKITTNGQEFNFEITQVGTDKNGLMMAALIERDAIILVPEGLIEGMDVAGTYFPIAAPTEMSYKVTTLTQLDNKYLEPFETVGGDTLTWDGNIEGLTGVDFDGAGTHTHYCISGTVPSDTDVANGATITMIGGAIRSTTFTDTGTGFMYENDFAVLIVDENAVGVDIDGLLFDKAGIYVTDGVSSLTINGFTGFPATKLKEEYLPDNVGGGGAEPFVVDFAMDGNGNITPDKTVVEILEAFEAKKNIYGIMANGSHDYAVFGLHGINGENATFVSCASDGSEVALAVIFLSRTSSTPASMILKSL